MNMEHRVFLPRSAKYWEEKMQIRNINSQYDLGKLDAFAAIVIASKYSTLQRQVQIALCSMAAVILTRRDCRRFIYLFIFALSATCCQESLFCVLRLGFLLPPLVSLISRWR